jgi:fibronectin-binding autotransporter adhesin
MSFRYRCVLLGTLLTLAGAAAVPAGALATVTTCPGPGSTSWINPSGGDWNVAGNWSNGVPGTGCDAVIALAGTYTVFATSGGPLGVTLGGSSGTQTLQILGTTNAGSPQDALFNVGADNLTVHASGVLQLTGSGSNTGGATITGGGTIVNSGLVETDLGVSGGTTNRDIQNGVTNNPGGTVALNADTNTCGCGGTHHWTNDGTIITAPGTTSTFTGTAQGVLFTQTTGSFVNQGRALISGGFTNAGGTTSGNPIEFCGTSLDAHGSGAASFEFDPLPELNCGAGGVGGNLTGDIGPNTTVLVHNTTSAATVSLSLNPSITNHGTLTFDGGPGQDQLVGNGSTPFTNAGTLNLNAASGAPSTHFVSHVTNTGTLDVGPGSNADIAGPFTDAGGAVNVAPGGNFSTSSATVSGGTLTVNGTFDPGGTLPLTGGILQGTGTIAQSVDNSGGIVHPGNSPGILSISGSYTQAAGATLAVDVAGSTPGAGYSQLALSGSATLAGGLTVTTSIPQTGTFRVLTASSVAGTFSSANFTGESFTVAYAATGVDLTGTAPPPGPGPGSAPTNTGVPTVSGSPSVGHMLSASVGTWTGAPTSYVYQWERCNASGAGCADIAGASSATYTAAAADIGHALRVRVTATNASGPSSATSAATAAVPSGAKPPPVVSLTGVRLGSRAFTAAVGTVLSFTLSQPVKVSVVISRRVVGHRSHGRCTLRARKGRRCSLTVLVRTITLHGVAGANRFAVHFGALKPGAYTLTVQVRTTAGRILSTTRAITIKRPRRTHP